ncbi:hypothetical protein SCORR_v1c04730 [Spiroplasma corruscae]|uniref:Lipoprotein n=1 Tax=Spiroplasma corruscae TaxID=216934 RepID=A0A222EP03_9MOLU|nr:hypothetical protein [Spiroplasma corruscae]ASP28245.1 hypothetical protein SCORR_v1c04730 [Spiroplasma corruscae]
MKGFLKVISFLSINGVTTTSLMSVVSCGESYVKKIYELHPAGPNNSWVSSESQGGPVIIEVDTRNVSKYVLSEAIGYDACHITFYLKDGTINNTLNKYWAGPPEEYGKYIKSVIGISPTEE